MKIYRHNIISICLLSLLIIFGFILLSGGQPTAVQSMSSLQSACSTAHAGESNWAVLLGIAGLVYLKIIWKLIHTPDIFDD